MLGFEIVGQDADGSRDREHQLADQTGLSDFLAQCARISGFPRRRTRGGRRATRPTRRAARPGRSRPSLTVVAPTGTRDAVPRDRSRRFVSLCRNRHTGGLPGPPGRRSVERFAVNLFDRAESDVGVRPTQDSGRSNFAAGRHPHRRTSTWRPRPIARPRGGRFGRCCSRVPCSCLVLEWYIYNRRVYL